jgi:RimJ/RimL family protein N-acetyltransferase
MADPDEGPVFPDAPPARIDLRGGRALARAQAGRAAATAASVNESLEHLAPWMAWAQEPATETGMATFLAAGEALWDQRRDFGYSILEGPDERVVGGCGLHGRLDEHGLEIGYWVHVDRIDQGIATEVAAALTEAAFRIPGIERVRIQCADSNVRSSRVPAKLGYSLLRVEVPATGPCEGRPTQIWEVEAADWMAKGRESAS